MEAHQLCPTEMVQKLWKDIYMSEMLPNNDLSKSNVNTVKLLSNHILQPNLILPGWPQDRLRLQGTIVHGMHTPD